jgi:uncharacterized membrane protein YeaQ/YmgE (transglycosylase-associated protein family)
MRSRLPRARQDGARRVVRAPALISAISSLAASLHADLHGEGLFLPITTRRFELGEQVFDLAKTSGGRAQPKPCISAEVRLRRRNEITNQGLVLRLAMGRLRTKEADLGIIAWLVLGLIAGFIASKLVNKTGEGLVLDIVLGIVGAFVGGFVFNHFFSAAGVTGLNLYSMFVAVIGAVIVLVLYHLVFRRRAM